MTAARVVQVAGQVVHGGIAGAAGIAMTQQVTAQIVRDRADWVGDFARVVQCSALVVYGGVPADEGIGRVSQIAVQVVRSVGTVGAGSGGARRGVVVVGG